MSLLGAGDQPGAINKVVRARTISNHALQSTLQVSYRRIKAETMRALSRRELAVYMPSGSASNITTRHCELHLFLCHRPCPFSWLLGSLQRITNSVAFSPGTDRPSDQYGRHMH